MNWVQKQMMNGVNPRTFLSHLMGDTSHVPTQVDDLTLWKVLHRTVFCHPIIKPEVFQNRSQYISIILFCFILTQ